MATSRRDFLKRGSLVALAAGVPLSIAEKISGKAISYQPDSDFKLKKSDFEAQLNTKFVIGEKPRNVAANLVKVNDLPSTKTIANGKEGFTLLFRGSRKPTLKQNTYTITHKKLGTFSLLLVPMVSNDDPSAHYEAVINRLYP